MVIILIVVRLCGLVVRVPGYRSRGRGRFPALPDFLRSSGVHSASWVQLKSYLEEKSSGSGLENRETAVGIRHADHVALSVRKSSY
jgi:hypothetical protein